MTVGLPPGSRLSDSPSRRAMAKAMGFDDTNESRIDAISKVQLAAILNHDTATATRAAATWNEAITRVNNALSATAVKFVEPPTEADADVQWQPIDWGVPTAYKIERRDGDTVAALGAWTTVAASHADTHYDDPATGLGALREYRVTGVTGLGETAANSHRVGMAIELPDATVAAVMSSVGLVTVGEMFAVTLDVTGIHDDVSVVWSVTGAGAAHITIAAQGGDGATFTVAHTGQDGMAFDVHAAVTAQGQGVAAKAGTAATVTVTRCGELDVPPLMCTAGMPEYQKFGLLYTASATVTASGGTQPYRDNKGHTLADGVLTVTATNDPGEGGYLVGIIIDARGSYCSVPIEYQMPGDPTAPLRAVIDLWRYDKLSEKRKRLTFRTRGRGGRPPYSGVGSVTRTVAPRAVGSYSDTVKDSSVVQQSATGTLTYHAPQDEIVMGMCISGKMRPITPDSYGNRRWAAWVEVIALGGLPPGIGAKRYRWAGGAYDRVPTETTRQLQAVSYSESGSPTVQCSGTDSGTALPNEDTVFATVPPADTPAEALAVDMGSGYRWHGESVNDVVSYLCPLTPTVRGGTEPYLFVWSAGLSGHSVAAQGGRTPLAVARHAGSGRPGAASFSLSVTDAAGSQVTGTAHVEAYSTTYPLVVSLTARRRGWNDANFPQVYYTIEVDVSAAGGQPPYTITPGTPTLITSGVANRLFFGVLDSRQPNTVTYLDYGPSTPGGTVTLPVTVADASGQSETREVVVRYPAYSR